MTGPDFDVAFMLYKRVFCPERIRHHCRAQRAERQYLVRVLP